jgi:hypothetical protein
MEKEAHVFFVIIGLSKQDVSDFTCIIGIEPSIVRVTGRSRHWQIISPLPESAHIDAHIEALLKMLEPRAEAVRSLTERFEAGIHCAMTQYYDESYAGSGIHLWQPTVKALAALNLQITFDLFFLKKSDES